MDIKKGKKITIFTDEETRYHGRLLYEAVLSELNRIGISYTSVTRGMAGFGRESTICQ
jgi:PII-like signaling protein